MTEEDFEEMEQRERQKHDDKEQELEMEKTELEKKAEEWCKDNVGVLDSYYLYPKWKQLLKK